MKHSIGYRSKADQSAGQSNYHSFEQRDKRHIVRLRAKARQPIKDIEVSVIVTNLSRTGCKLESLISLDPKAPVLIVYRHYPSVRAQIMWSKTGSHGCKFDKPLPEKLLDELVGTG